MTKTGPRQHRRPALAVRAAAVGAVLAGAAGSVALPVQAGAAPTPAAPAMTGTWVFTLDGTFGGKPLQQLGRFTLRKDGTCVGATRVAYQGADHDHAIRACSFTHDRDGLWTLFMQFDGDESARGDVVPLDAAGRHLAFQVKGSPLLSGAGELHRVR